MSKAKAVARAKLESFEKTLDAFVTIHRVRAELSVKTAKHELKEVEPLNSPFSPNCPISTYSAGSVAHLSWYHGARPLALHTKMN